MQIKINIKYTVNTSFAMRSVFYSSAVQGLPAQGTQVSSHRDESCSSRR